MTHNFAHKLTATMIVIHDDPYFTGSYQSHEPSLD